MLSIIKSYGLLGINGYAVNVEVDIGAGLPGIELVGLPDVGIKESKERVKSAIKNSGFSQSPKKITINFAPADTKKEGSFYDLPIAIGLLSATEQLPYPLMDAVFLGELSLDGSISHIKGIMPILISAKENGVKNVIIPKANENEAKYIDGITVYAFSSLREVVSFLFDATTKEPVEKINLNSLSSWAKYSEDFKYVKGQFAAKRALEISAAGAHNILLIGPPGGGKTMMAKCLPTILPDITVSEALETTKIHSVSGILDDEIGIIRCRPFVTPHHTVSRIAMTGGGATAKPGLISHAHNGVLFLDEMLEYPRTVLEILRQPLEDNVITISRAMRSVEYPANFMLVASMNPCPCGNRGSSTADCTCSPAQVTKYMAKLSAPLMDRIDLHINVDNVTYNDLVSDEKSEDSATIKERVNVARKIQLARFKNLDIYSNAKMNNQMVKEFCVLDAQCEQLLKSAFDKLGLSARAYNRILKVSRTIADLDGAPQIKSKHISEAIMYRSLDRSRNYL